MCLVTKRRLEYVQIKDCAIIHDYKLKDSVSEVVYIRNLLDAEYCPKPLASPAMGHWGMCPSATSNCWIFLSPQSRTNSDIRLHICGSLPTMPVDLSLRIARILYYFFVCHPFLLVSCPSSAKSWRRYCPKPIRHAFPWLPRRRRSRQLLRTYYGETGAMDFGVYVGPIA